MLLSPPVCVLNQILDGEVKTLEALEVLLESEKDAAQKSQLVSYLQKVSDYIEIMDEGLRPGLGNA